MICVAAQPVSISIAARIGNGKSRFRKILMITTPSFDNLKRSTYRMCNRRAEEIIEMRFLSPPGDRFLVCSTNENPQIHDNSQFVIIFFPSAPRLGIGLRLAPLCFMVFRVRLAKGRRKTVLWAGANNGLTTVDLCN